MESFKIAELVAASRHAAFLSDPSDTLEAIDVALESTTDTADRGALFLARALAQQGSSDTSSAAADARASVEHLRQTADRPAATFASACAAGLTQRSGDTTRALDLAVDALVLLREGEGFDEQLVRAANAMAVLFAEISAFDLANVASRRAIADAPLGLDPSTRAAITYTSGYCAVEAIRSGQSDHTTRQQLERYLDEVIACLTSSMVHERERVLLGSGMIGERLLLRFLDDRNAPVDDGEIRRELLALVPMLDEGRTQYGETSPRLKAWHQLVFASVLRQLRQPLRAREMLDEAIPTLISTHDEHRIVRALNERSEASVMSGDLIGALKDSRQVAELCRGWQQTQGERLGAQISHRAELEWGRSQLRRRTDELAKQAAEDEVTGLATRRWLEKELDALSLTDGTGTVIIFDLDHFKDVNDKYGHQTGDDVLREVGAILRNVADRSIVARFGGEEFVVLLPSADMAVGMEMAERVRAALEAYDWGTIAVDLCVTVSAGVADGALSEIREVLRIADMALYQAKRTGRDQVMTIGDLPQAA